MGAHQSKSLILWSNGALAGSPFEAALSTSGLKFENFKSSPVEQLLAKPRSHIVIADCELGVHKISSLQESTPQTPVVYLYNGPRSELINTIFSRPNARHALGHNDIVLPHEIAPILALASGKLDSWSVMAKGTAELFTSRHWDGSMIAESVEEARRAAAGLNTYSEFENYVATSVWELLTNAIYDARRGTDIELPRDAQGAIPIDQRLDKQLVTLEIRHDLGKIAVRIQDHLGRLKPSMVLENWKRADARALNQIKSDDGGAGVGLYMVLHETAQLIFTVRRNISSEVIFTLPIERMNRSFLTRIPSIHFFELRS